MFINLLCLFPVIYLYYFTLGSLTIAFRALIFTVSILAIGTSIQIPSTIRILQIKPNGEKLYRQLLKHSNLQFCPCIEVYIQIHRRFIYEQGLNRFLSSQKRTPYRQKTNVCELACLPNLFKHRKL